MPIIQAANGAKVRCESKRRYWIIRTWSVPNSTVPAADILRRTDNVVLALTIARHHTGRAVYDSLAKEYIR